MKLNQLSLIAITAIFLTACISESGSEQSPMSSPPISSNTNTVSAANPDVNQTTQEPLTPIVIAPITQPDAVETTATQAEILPWLRIPMHYKVLLGRSQVWGETEGTLTLNLASPAFAASSTLQLSSSNNLLPQQLISYYGSDGQYYSSQIQDIEGTKILLSTPLKQNISAGQNIWNFYDNGSHPNSRGYRVIADHAVRHLGKDKLNQGVHLLLGDSWFNDPVIFERLKTHLTAATIINKGVGGNTTTNLLARFDADVLPFNPSFVWIMSGTNDYWQNVTTATYKSNMKTLIAKIKAINAVPVIFDSSVGPLNFGTDAVTELSHSYVTAIDELLAEN